MGGVCFAESAEWRLGLGSIPTYWWKWTYPTHDHGGCGKGRERVMWLYSLSVILPSFSLASHFSFPFIPSSPPLSPSFSLSPRMFRPMKILTSARCGFTAPSPERRLQTCLNIVSDCTPVSRQPVHVPVYVTVKYCCWFKLGSHHLVVLLMLPSFCHLLNMLTFMYMYCTILSCTRIYIQCIYMHVWCTCRRVWPCI